MLDCQRGGNGPVKQAVSCPKIMGFDGGWLRTASPTCAGSASAGLESR
jgi:hypothetical protein